ncbi:MAG: DUF362 domain-containing protein [Thermodesulfobacteriota bacterium]
MDVGRLRSPMSLTRREVLAACAAASASLAAKGCAPTRAGAAATPPPAPPPLAPGPAVPIALAGVPRGATPESVAQAVRRAACAPDDLAWLARGDTVFVKVAANSGNGYPATTDPIAVRAMVELLRERGAGRVIVGDMSGVQAVRFWKDGLRGSSRELMRENGIARAAHEAGAELHAFEEAGWDGFFAESPKVAGSWAGPIMLPAVLREVDHVVLLPRCARHVLAGSTLALKAAVGWWRHDSRLEYHRDAATFAQKTADASTVPTILEKQRLVLTSATRVLTTFGPDDGYDHDPEHGLVFASPSPVAHDMLSLAWLLEGRAATPESERTGLLDDPNQSGTFVNLANRIVTTWLGGLGEALRAERLERYDLATIWDDRVLARAFQTAGGVPRVELGAVNEHIPPALLERLARQVSPSGVG